MIGKRFMTLTVLAAGVVATVSAAGALAGGGGHDHGNGGGSVTVITTGLENPRGLTFGPDGGLYVAEGGSGGILSTIGQCDQALQAGPYTGGFTSRISRIDRYGHRTTVVDGLPSSTTSPNVGSLVSGVADVKFLDGTLYGIEAGAGCSHGLAGTVNSVFRVNRNGSTAQVADLSGFQKANPPADDTYEEDDWEPDGTWYSMVVSDDSFYAVEPNHQEVDRISRHGKISRLLDMSAASVAAKQWIGPTTITSHDGDFYLGNLSEFPIVPGSASIFKLTRSGRLSVVATGLSTVLGSAWDDHGRLFVLESMTAAGFPGPGEVGQGMVVRVDRDGTITPVVTGLSFPSAMTFGPDDDLYISNLGFAAPAGEIVRVDESCLDRRGSKPPCSY